MNESLAKDFDELVKTCGARTRAEVFRRAMATYKALVDVEQSGSLIFVEDEGGENRCQLKLV
jgi:hypothetical protein